MNHHPSGCKWLNIWPSLSWTNDTRKIICLDSLKIPLILFSLFFELHDFDNIIENSRLKNNWKTWLFAFWTPRIGFNFWANTVFHKKLKTVHICPNFFYFAFTTSNINLVALFRDTQPATTTTFVWIPKESHLLHDAYYLRGLTNSRWNQKWHFSAYSENRTKSCK